MWEKQYYVCMLMKVSIEKENPKYGNFIILP